MIFKLFFFANFFILLISCSLYSWWSGKIISLKTLTLFFKSNFLKLFGFPIPEKIKYFFDLLILFKFFIFMKE